MKESMTFPIFWTQLKQEASRAGTVSRSCSHLPPTRCCGHQCVPASTGGGAPSASATESKSSFQRGRFPSCRKGVSCRGTRCSFYKYKQTSGLHSHE